MARAYALAARAHASGGDVASADALMVAAEHALDRTPSDDDPPWIRFFTATQLQTEFLYVACSLGRIGQVDRLAADVLVVDTEMQRRHVLAGASIAGALASGQQASRRDPEQAVAVLDGLIPTAAGLSSARTITSIQAARHQLDSYGSVAGLDSVDHHLRMLTATG